MSGDGYARLLEVAQRHIAGMKSGEPATIKMEQAFTYNLAWGMTKASIQAREEKLELGLAVPNDDVIVQDVINTFNNIGVTMLPHHVSEDGKQMTLAFKDITPETEKEAKEWIILYLITAELPFSKSFQRGIDESTIISTESRTRRSKKGNLEQDWIRCIIRRCCYPVR